MGGETAHRSGGLCYVLVCFRSREFVAFLLASLYRPDDLFLIHCDKKAPTELKSYLAPRKSVVCLNVATTMLPEA